MFILIFSFWLFHDFLTNFFVYNFFLLVLEHFLNKFAEFPEISFILFHEKRGVHASQWTPSTPNFPCN